MARIRTRDTDPEIRLRRALWAAGIRGWRLHARELPGRPDIVWRGRRVAVFVDGAFWHGHPNYYWGQSGKFWNEKIEGNQKRDEKVTRELVAEGWVVLRLWDFEIEHDIARCVEAVRSALGPDTAKEYSQVSMSSKKNDTLGRRLKEVSEQVLDLGRALKNGQGEREAIDEIVAELRAIQLAWFGNRERAQRGHGGRVRIRKYFLSHVGERISGEELAEISGIQEWPRRIRELRVEDGYDIAELGRSTYRLESAEPDSERAAAWRIANSIRRSSGSATQRVGAFLEANVGRVVTRAQIDYVAKIAEGSRRVRELRDEHGWPIETHIDDPDLQSGEYRLTSVDLRDRRDPLQRLYPEGIRQKVFERDSYTCRVCGKDRTKAEAEGDTRFYLEVHHRVAVTDELEALPKSKRNQISNLVTLCHADHIRESRKLQQKKRKERRPKR